MRDKRTPRDVCGEAIAGDDLDPGGGYSIYPWVGRCGPAPHTLTLFKTKIADFPTLFKTEFRFLIPCLRHFVEHRRRLFIVQEKIPSVRVDCGLGKVTERET